MYDGQAEKKKTNPREKANLLSRITFFFVFPLIRRGYKRDIADDDIFEVPTRFRSKRQGNFIEQEWEKETTKEKKSSLYRLLCTCYGRRYLLLGVVQLVVKIIMTTVHPRALSKLVSYFTSSSTLTKLDAIYYALVVVGLTIGNSIYSHNYLFWITELGIKIKAAVSSLVYRKALKLKSQTLSEIGVGRLLTIISKDVASIEIALLFINDIWIGFVVLALTSGLIFSRVGVAALPGILFLVLIIPLQVILGKLTTTLRLKGSKITDRRLQATQESLSAIKIVKMYTWERFFEQKVLDQRKEEMKSIRNIYWTKATALVMGALAISLTSCIIVFTYVKLGNIFTAEVAVFISACINSLRSTIAIFIPIGIAQTAEMIASVQRICKVLTAEEQAEPTREQFAKSSPFIQMEQVAVSINNTSILHNINLRIGSGLNFLVGRLGGGKSSLLKTILEEYPVTEGKMKVQGSISYVSEEPWLFPASIKQNIIFGQEFNEERYKKILKICSLELDLNTFDKSDETILDDRGMNMSKGQQARICLARAVYCDSDIYLIDNCLSSLDTHVQEQVFTECIKNFLSNKIVLMISHNEQQLKQADSVIYMEGGTIKSNLKPSDIPETEIEALARENDEEEEEDIIDKIVIEDDESKNESDSLLTKKKQNIFYEEKKKGEVAFGAYIKFANFGGGWTILIPLLVLFVAGQVASSSSQILESYWVNIQQNLSEYRVNASNSTEEEYTELFKKNDRIINLYTGVVVASAVLLLSRAYSHFAFSGRVSVALHKVMAVSVMRSTMKFFDLNYIGNILNRFSKDLANVDELLPLNLYECANLVCKVTGTLVLIIIVNMSFVIPAVVVFFVMYCLRKWYLPTGRSLKRLETASRSPMVSHINASLEGLVTIRAYGTEVILVKEFDRHQDSYISTYYMSVCASRAFAFYLDLLCSFFISAIILRFVIVNKDTDAGNISLAIKQALALTGMLQWGIKQWTELENHMTSVERVLEYTIVEKEKRSGIDIQQWPTSGKISYENVNLTYGKTKDYVLKNVTFIINPKEKVGIVGRTGAGKSSLISVLFRLYQYEGTIWIDGVDIKTLSLDFLRSNIAIIPQDPVLFNGTIRSNVDPTGGYKDEEIWKAIRTTHLGDLISSLDDRITVASKFSSGQKQLLCLARAVINKSKIIILDEATANMDAETDALIYSTIQENFADCTVLTIAHRLHTVKSSDKVMVVDKGRIVEFDDPNILLENSNGIFYKMMKHAKLLK